MNWMDWVLVTFFGLGALLTVLQINEPRKPINPPTAAWIVIIEALLILGVVLVR